MSADTGMRLFLERDQLLKIADEHRGDYATAQPFPHAVLDGLFPEDVLDQVLAEFPDPESPVWKTYESYHEKKLETQGEQRLGDATCFLLYQFNSAPFLAFLERLTGIDNLLPDPYFYGGGLHQIVRGGKLGVHADFNAHERLPLQRRLNVLVYLNHDWQEEYGGALELWDQDRSRCHERILPMFNRTVIFTITDWAYHGHPEPLNCPDGTSRKSIALYYYTVDRPAGEVLGGKHSTLWMQRPGETFPEGLGSTATGSPRRERMRHTLRRIAPPIAVDAARALRRRGQR